MYGSGSVGYNLERNNAPFSLLSNSEAYVVWNPAARCHADVTSPLMYSMSVKQVLFDLYRLLELSHHVQANLAF